MRLSVFETNYLAYFILIEREIDPKAYFVQLDYNLKTTIFIEFLYFPWQGPQLETIKGHFRRNCFQFLNETCSILVKKKKQKIFKEIWISHQQKWKWSHWQR